MFLTGCLAVGVAGNATLAQTSPTRSGVGTTTNNQNQNQNQNQGQDQNRNLNQ